LIDVSFSCHVKCSHCYMLPWKLCRERSQTGAKIQKLLASYLYCLLEEFVDMLELLVELCPLRISFKL